MASLLQTWHAAREMSLLKGTKQKATLFSSHTEFVHFTAQLVFYLLALYYFSSSRVPCFLSSPPHVGKVNIEVNHVGEN